MIIVSWELIMRVNQLLVIILISCLPAVVHAHGNDATGGERRNAELPWTFWDYFISNADSSLTISIKQNAGYRYLKTNGIAGHPTGSFPNSGNPHSITPKESTYRVSLHPARASKSREVGHADFGVAINGIPFDAATAEFWGGGRRGEWNYEAITGGINLGLDQNNAHVQPDGTYHYHGQPVGLLNQHPYTDKPVLIGYAADGFPIYSPYGYKDANSSGSGLKELTASYRIKKGTRSSGPGGKYDGRFSKDWEYVSGAGDLDVCNGRRGITPEHPEGTYYYVITEQFPYIPRCWVGVADDSFQKRPGKQRGIGTGGRSGGFGQPLQGDKMRRDDHRGPPQGAINACEGKSENTTCRFTAPMGSVSGQCRTISGGGMACVPEHHSRGPR